MINRRQFLTLSASVLFAGPTRLLRASSQPRLLSCWSDTDNRHYVSLLDPRGGSAFDVQLPARGHGIAINQQQKLAAVFARRPGDFVCIIKLRDGKLIGIITATEGRHFYGHGVFTPDGQYLLCSENAFESGEGRIGLYDCRNGFQRVGELPSHGIGPHEVKLLADGKTLVVANGGIKTHPDLPRIKTNLNTMKPNLAYLETSSGGLLEKVEPPAKWHQLSIRHLDVAADNTVAVAMQYQGKPTERPPLIAIHRPGSKLTGSDFPGSSLQGSGLKLLTAPDRIQRKMKNYCGSVTFSHDNSRFAVSSPRGNLVTYWRIDGTYMGSHQQKDACGISQHANGFFVSDGTGTISLVKTDLSASDAISLTNHRWDNHMVSLL